MSKRSELLIACMLGKRWSATSAPNAGTTCVATTPTAPVNSKIHMDQIWYSIRNGGPNFTVQVQVRGAANTVFATVEHILLGTSSANVSVSNPNYMSKAGSSLNVFMNTVLASVVQAVNIAGWIEDTNG